jgi:hypothetical protein
MRGHCFEPFLIPSQLLAFEVLRRPLDFTQYPLINVVSTPYCEGSG